MPKLLQIHLLVFLLATTGILGRLIDMPAPALVAWRTGLAAVAAALWLSLVCRRPLVPPRRALLAMLGVGVIIGLHWMAFFGAIRLANVSVAVAGLATTSLFTAFTEPWLEHRRIRPFEILLGLLVVAGISLIAGSAADHLTGLLVAVLAGFLAALFPVLNRMLVRGHEPVSIVAWEMLGACAVCLAVVPWSGGFGTLQPRAPADLGWILVLALLCTVFAHAFHVHLLRSLSAYTTNLAMNFEPVYGMLMAAWLFHEHQSLAPLFYLGAVAIILANFLHPLVLQRMKTA